MHATAMWGRPPWASPTTTTRRPSSRTYRPALVGVVAQDNFATTASAGIGAANVTGLDHERGAPPGLEQAAEALGVSVEALMNAFGTPGHRPDFAAAAEALGVTEADLRNALPARP